LFRDLQARPKIKIYIVIATLDLNNTFIEEHAMKRYNCIALVLLSLTSIGFFTNIQTAQACNPFDPKCPDSIPDPFSKDKPSGQSQKTQEEKDKEELMNAIKNPGGRSEDTDPKEKTPQTSK
jgi:hypothetical protein